MKPTIRWRVAMLIIGMIGILGACNSSSTSEVKLVKAKAGLIHDKSEVGAVVLQEGEHKGKEVVPTALLYTVVLQNEGKQPIGNEKEEIRVNIVPHESLVKASETVMGFNLFGPEEIGRPGLGYGHSFPAVLEDTGEYKFFYKVGYEEGSPEVIPLPSKDELALLEKHALDATIEVWVGDKLIVRFDLTSRK